MTIVTIVTVIFTRFSRVGADPRVCLNNYESPNNKTGRHRSLPIQWGKGIVSPSGDERGAFLKCLVVGPFYLPYVRRFPLRLRNMLFLFQPRLLALLIFLAVSFEIVVGHDVIRADG